MTRDQIIALAEEAGMIRDGDAWFSVTIQAEQDVITDDLVEFAHLVARAERNACAKVCDEQVISLGNGSREGLIAGICASVIRARS